MISFKDKLWVAYRDRVGLGTRVVLPSFLIIGAQKAGTTALHAFLRRHPLMLAPPEKEIDFFSCNTAWNSGFTTYSRYFRFFMPRANAISYEASPSYAKHRHSAERIHAYNSDLKIVYVVRDPVLRAYSAYHMYKRKHAADPDFYTRWYDRCYSENSNNIERRTRDSFRSFEAFVSEEIAARKSGKEIELEVLTHGMYYSNIKPFTELFGIQNIHVMHSADLLNNTRQSLALLGDFVGFDASRMSIQDGEQVFKGNYAHSMTEAERRVTGEFYQHENAQFFDLCGVKFDWIHP